MPGFDNTNYDLGVDTFGLTKDAVDEVLRGSQYTHGCRCILCGNTAQYKIIPKAPEFDTAEVQDKGYVCGNCLTNTTNIDKRNYGVRELK
jgi:hypothetical protein